MLKAKVDWFVVLLAVFGVLGSGLVLLRTATYGVALTNDSGLYITTAQNLIEGRGFTALQQPYGAPPFGGASPFFPLLLAVLSLLGLGTIEAAEYVNAIAFGLIIFIISMWLKARVTSRTVIVWAACACALSISLADVSASAWTEPIFVVFSVGSLFALDRFLSTGKQSSLIWGAVSAAAALLTRYTGVILIIVGLLVVYLRKKHTPWRIKLSNAALWIVILIAPFSLWMLRNIFVLGHPLGGVIGNEFTALTSIYSATNEIILWIIGPIWLSFLDSQIEKYIGFGVTESAILTALVLKLAFLAYVMIGVWFLFTRLRSGFFSKNRDVLTICGGFMISYGLFLAVVLPISDVELPIRYLVPLVPPSIVIMTLAIDEFIANLDTLELGPGSYFNIIDLKKVCTLILLTGWLLLWVGPNVSQIKILNTQGKGYRDISMADNEVIKYINDTKPYNAVCSNQPVVLYFLVEDSDKLKLYALPKDLDDAKAHVSLYCTGSDDLVVWFFRQSFPLTYGLTEFGTSLAMEAVAIFKEGVIFIKDSTNSISRSTDFLFGSLFAETELIIDSYFEVYMDNRRNRLIYMRQNWCELSDFGSKIILRVFPVDDADLSYSHINPIFDDFSFDFGDHVVPIDKQRCVGIRSLPEYDISHIITGQQIIGGDGSWTGEFTFTH